MAKESVASLRSATLRPSQEELMAAVALEEGGFMGFGGEQVSAGEQQMLDQVRAGLGVA